MIKYQRDFLAHPGEAHSLPRAELSRRQLEANKRHLQARNCASQIANFNSKRKVRKAFNRASSILRVYHTTRPNVRWPSSAMDLPLSTVATFLAKDSTEAKARATVLEVPVMGMVDPVDIALQASLAVPLAHLTPPQPLLIPHSLVLPVSQP
jgi:hypothetical protein